MQKNNEILRINMRHEAFFLIAFAKAFFIIAHFQVGQAETAKDELDPAPIPILTHVVNILLVLWLEVLSFETKL